MPPDSAGALDRTTLVLDAPTTEHGVALVGTVAAEQIVLEVAALNGRNGDLFPNARDAMPLPGEPRRRWDCTWGLLTREAESQ